MGSFPNGERKLVTVLFGDLAGFTAFSAERDPEEVQEYITGLWARLDALIAAHGGTTEKHIGDALMALFGGRQAREEDPVQAVRAALALQACVGEVSPGGPPSPLQMRIGIHTGMVALSPADPAGERIATGDTVNLASRLEQNAPTSGVLISHDTYRHVYGSFDLQVLPPLTVKGKTDPIQTYLVLRARPRSLARTLRGVAGVETEMIGREPELKHLQSAFQSVLEERQPQVLTIVGEAGIGKSRLLWHFEKWVEALPEPVRLFCGRATPEMAGLPFSLMRDVFSARFEIHDSDPATAAREKFERGLLYLLGADGRICSGDAPRAQAHFIGHLLGFDFSASPYLRELLNDPEQVRHRAFSYLSRFFAGLGRKVAPAKHSEAKAVLLVAEDVHWCDDGSLDLIDHLARTCQGEPLMILCLARPGLFERRPAWGEGLPEHTRLSLEPLSRRESRLLVETILRKAHEIPQSLRDLILTGAEGNPFYIEEIIKMLIDRRVIVPGAERWRIESQRLAAPSDTKYVLVSGHDRWRAEPECLVVAPIPPTLTGVLQARVDGLAPLERAVLQRASVVGRVFWDSAIEQLSGLGQRQPGAHTPPEGAPSQQEILEALGGLRRKELIFRRETSAFDGAVEYFFKHELLRNVTYEGLLKRSRRQYHAQMAAWLIEHIGVRITEFTGLVAAHFELAGRLAEAAEWFGLAGEQARARYAPAIAVEYLRKALALLPAESAPPGGIQAKRLGWYKELGKTLAAQARFDQAQEAWVNARALAESVGDVVAQARALNGLAFLHERRGDNRASVEAAERAELLARGAGEAGHGELIRAMHLRGWACYRLGDAPTVLALGQQTLKLCSEFNDRRGMATSYKLHGVAHLQLGHYLKADGYFREGLALCQELDDRRNAAAMWSNLGESARMRGDYHAASELYQKALAIVREIGNRASEVIYLSNLAGARLGLGQFAQAEADVRHAITLTAEPKSCSLPETYSFLAAACLGQGKVSEALEAARHAVALARASENHLDLGGAWRALGQAAAALQNPASRTAADLPASAGPPDDPPACFDKSLRLFRHIDAEGEQARTLQAWAEFELQQGRAHESRKKSEEAESILRRLGAASGTPAPSPAS